MPLMHIVLFTLDQAKVEANPEAKQAMLSALQALDQLPMVLKITVGSNDTSIYEGMADRAKGYNIGYTCLLDDAQNLKAYSDSAQHQAVVKDHIKPLLVAGGILAMDYNC